MELKQLEAYVKVYELRSFSKAAQEMYISQPSISAYISALEQELKTQLIYRSTKEFLPTKQGEIFYQHSKEMLSLRDKSITSLKNLSDCTAGCINILASSVPAQYLLPEILGAFHKIYPNIFFNVKQADTAEVVKGISSLTGEIGFVGSKIENSKCVYEKILSEKLIIIAPNEKRFENISQSDIISLLQNEYFVLREFGSGTRLEYEESFEKLGFSAKKLKVSACFDSTQSIIHAVYNGLGLSIVSELAAKQYIEQKFIIPIEADFLPQRHFYTVLKKNYPLPPPLDTFLKFLRQKIAQ